MDVLIEHLRHTYVAPDLEARTVLDINAWHAPAGEQVLLRGFSGSGKTTLLNILAGLLPPSAGTVWLGGHAPVSYTHLDVYKRQGVRASASVTCRPRAAASPSSSAVPEGASTFMR